MPRKQIEPEEISRGENEKREDAIDIEYESIKTISQKGGVLLVIENEEVWLPMSQIFYADENKIEIPIWLAGEKGLD